VTIGSFQIAFNVRIFSLFVNFGVNLDVNFVVNLVVNANVVAALDYIV